MKQLTEIEMELNLNEALNLSNFKMKEIEEIKILF